MVFLIHIFYFASKNVLSDFLKNQVLQSESSEPIKEQTARILDEAKEIRARLDGDTQAQQEYDEIRLSTIWALKDLQIDTRHDLENIRAELWNWWSIDPFTYAQWEINQWELEKIQQEFEDLQNLHLIEQKDISELNDAELREILRISQENYYTFEDEANTWDLSNMISWAFSYDTYNNVSSRRELHTFQDRIIERIYGSDLGDNGFDWENIYGFGEERWWNFIIWISEMEQELITKSPNEWNSLALVNYFKMLQAEWSFDIWVLLEKLGADKIIALGNLWKTQPNWPAMMYFQESRELSWIVDGVTSIDFESMIFSWDLNSFERISELFDVANEDDRDTMQETIHWLLYDALDNWNVDQLRSIADIENVWALHEWMYRFTISSARKMVLAHEAMTSLEVLYRWGPDIWDIAKALILSAVNGVGMGENNEISFSLDGINSIIGEYNNENNWDYPLLWENYFQYLESIFNANSLIWGYSDNLTLLDDINWRISEIQSILRDESVRPEEKEVLRRELSWLYSRQYGISREVSNEEWALEESFENQAEYRRLLMSLTGSSINIDISREVHKNYILEDPSSRIILLDSAEDLLAILPEIDRRNIQISDINPAFLTHPDILRYIAQGDFRERDYSKLPSEVYQNQELCAILWEDKSHHWDTLFYNILLTQGPESSVDFISWLIFDNPETFGTEENSEILQKAIPQVIRLNDSEGKLEEIPVYNPDISSAEEFNDRVITYLWYFNNSEQNPELWNNTDSLGNISPISQEAVLHNWDWFESVQGIERENLQEYIRNYGLSSEIHTSIRALIENGRIIDIPFILSWLNPENSEELDLILLILDTYDTHYHYLSYRTQRHPDVIQKIWESGISNFTPEIISNITSERLFARYLIGYTTQDTYDLWDIRNNTNFEHLKGSIDTTIIDELSTEEIRALDEFYQRRIEIENMVSSLEGDLEHINESQIQQIKAILDREGIIWYEEEIPEDFNNLEEVDNFLVYVWERLEAVWKTDWEIQSIIQEILDINTQSARERVIVTDREWVDITPQMRSVLDEKGFILAWSTLENPNIDYDWLTRDYLEVYRNQHISESDLDNPEVIQAYLLSIWLNSEEANSIVRNLQSRVQFEIQRRAEESYPQWDSWREWLDNPPWLYGWTQTKMLEEISSWEYKYIPFENSWIPESTPLPENWNMWDLSPDFQSRLKQDWDNFFLLSDGKEIPLSREDVSIIHNNPEAESNLVDAYNIFSREWLERIWEHRDSMMQAIGNHDATWMRFNLRDWNYIDSTEMNYLLSTILYVTTENETYRNVWLRSLEDTISQVRRETQWAFWEENTRNIGQWENKIEEAFINRFTMRNQWDEGRFNYTTFSKALKWDFSPNPQ